MSEAAKRKLTRVERNEEVRSRLFHAAAQIVGERGYAETSIVRIIERAGVALGTFYKHFATRQALLDELLPAIGREMVDFIQARVDSSKPERDREIARFTGFFEYLAENPGFLRILNEAEFAAPAAFHAHLDFINARYVGLLKRGRARGEVGDFSDLELEAVVHMLMGARSYLSQRYGPDAGGKQAVFSAYAKLLERGLFTG